MSAETKRPYNEIFPIAQGIVTKLAPFCERIEIAGSLRRQRPVIGDIEIVALPKRPLDLFGQVAAGVPTELDQFLRDKLGDRMIKDGALLKSFMYGLVKVDLFLPQSPAHWGSIFTIRTGSHDFNMWLMSHQQRKAGVMFRDGLILRTGTAEVIPTPEEGDVFEALQLPYIPIDMRDDNRWNEVKP